MTFSYQKFPNSAHFSKVPPFFSQIKNEGEKRTQKTKANCNITPDEAPLGNFTNWVSVWSFQNQSLVLVNFPRIYSIPKKKAAVKHEKNLCFLSIDKYHSFMLQLFATCKEKSVISTDEKEHTNKVDNSHNQRQELSKSK